MQPWFKAKPASLTHCTPLTIGTHPQPDRRAQIDVSKSIGIFCANP